MEQVLICYIHIEYCHLDTKSFIKICPTMVAIFNTRKTKCKGTVQPRLISNGNGLIEEEFKICTPYLKLKGNTMVSPSSETCSPLT